MCKVKKPQVQPPAPAPPPPEDSAQVTQNDPITDNKDAADLVRRKGRNSLRIPLNSGGSGLNVPVN